MPQTSPMSWLFLSLFLMSVTSMFLCFSPQNQNKTTTSSTMPSINKKMSW